MLQAENHTSEKVPEANAAGPNINAFYTDVQVTRDQA